MRNIGSIWTDTERMVVARGIADNALYRYREGRPLSLNEILDCFERVDIVLSQPTAFLEANRDRLLKDL